VNVSTVNQLTDIRTLKALLSEIQQDESSGLRVSDQTYISVRESKSPNVQNAEEGSVSIRTPTM
jgi:hypothetical protein